jgi:hypothetical protein
MGKPRFGPLSKASRSEFRSGYWLFGIGIVVALGRIAVAVDRVAGGVAALSFVLTMLLALVGLVAMVVGRSRRPPGPKGLKARQVPPPGADAAFLVRYGYSTDYACPSSPRTRGRLTIFHDRLELNSTPSKGRSATPVIVAIEDILTVEAGALADTEVAEVFAKNYVTVQIQALRGCGMLKALHQRVDQVSPESGPIALQAD